MYKRTQKILYFLAILFLTISCAGVPQTRTESFQLEQMGQILITPPAGWDVWSAEDPFGNGWHIITFVANIHRKPGATIYIHTGDRQHLHTEESFLVYAEELYAESAYQFVEEVPSYRKLDVNNGIAQTYDLNIISPPDEKALLIVTIGKSRTGEPITEQQFNTLIEGRAEYLLPYAVEENVTYNELPISDGYSRYFILTDASFNNETYDPDDFKFVGAFYANYDNRCLLYATILSDDPGSTSFQLMLNILSGIEPMLQ